MDHQAGVHVDTTADPQGLGRSSQGSVRGPDGTLQAWLDESFAAAHQPVMSHQMTAPLPGYSAGFSIGSRDGAAPVSPLERHGQPFIWPSLGEVRELSIPPLSMATQQGFGQLQPEDNAQSGLSARNSGGLRRGPSVELQRGYSSFPQYKVTGGAEVYGGRNTGLSAGFSAPSAAMWQMPMADVPTLDQPAAHHQLRQEMLQSAHQNSTFAGLLAASCELKAGKTHHLKVQNPKRSAAAISDASALKRRRQVKTLFFKLVWSPTQLFINRHLPFPSYTFRIVTHYVCVCWGGGGAYF